MKKKKLNTETKKYGKWLKKMLNRDINVIDIMEVTGLTEDELLGLQEKSVTV